MTKADPNMVDSVHSAVACLRQGGVVAIPTETVYGLAGDAMNADAVRLIYTVKERPAINPLIAHCADIHMVERIAIVSPIAQRVIDAFCPGPLTLVLPRTQSHMCDMGCAGLDTVAVRIPSHPMAHNIISSLGNPIFAPSANKSGNLSATTADDVKTALHPHDVMVVDGGACPVGLESTIVRITDMGLEILRHGTITKHDLERAVSTPVYENAHAHTDNPIAPGQLSRHYAPNVPLHMNITTPLKNHAYLGFGGWSACHINLSENGILSEAAHNLFASLHALDARGYAAISVAPIPNTGIGIAINDKLRRAATEI